MTSAKRPIRRVACIGEVMIELIAGPGNSATLGVAGDTFNTAVYMVRSLRGSGIQVSYVTALGTDPYSERIMTTIRSHGLNSDFIERREGMMPGLYAIDTDAAGERSFSYWRSASAARTLFTEPCTIGLDRLDQFDLVYLSGISLAVLPPEIRGRILGWADAFRAGGGTLAYDSNHRPQLWESAEDARAMNASMWARADIALPSIDDEMALFGDPDEAALVARLRGYGVRRGGLKRGAAGPLDLSGSASGGEYPAAEKVVDSTAAGDSFNAGVLAALALGKTDTEGLQAGHALACRVIGAPGAIIPDDG